MTVAEALSCPQPAMGDRRRKGKTTNSFVDDTVKDFHAVDPTPVRRRSDFGDHESGVRNESWMSKVSLAMSTRIFSGSKKLNSSRSTQVMPLGAAVNDNSNTSVGRLSSSSLISLQESELHLQRAYSGPVGTQQTFRQEASEKATASPTEAISSPVTTFEACPSVICDVASDDSDDCSRDNGSGPRWSGSTLQRGDNHHSRRQRSSTVVQKVRPGGEDEEEDKMMLPIRTRVVSTPTRPREVEENDDAEVNVQGAAPILKSFFSKNVSLSKEQRREALYRESKQRQDKLREQTELERQASEESSRRRKVTQLQRLNRLRRTELLRDAVSARKNLLERIQVDNDKYHAERELWENDFEDEMRVLSDAFRKSRTNGDNRPMTAAGLAVPEAMSQLERDASNFEKRTKTAQPALASMPPRQHRVERPNTSRAMSSMSSSPFFESCEVLSLEDSKDVLDLFRVDDQTGAISPSKYDINSVANGTQSPDLDVDQLLGERERLLQLLAVIDQMVQHRQQ